MKEFISANLETNAAQEMSAVTRSSEKRLQAGESEGAAGLCLFSALSSRLAKMMLAKCAMSVLEHACRRALLSGSYRYQQSLLMP